MEETQEILRQMGFENPNDNVWKSQWFGYFILAKEATPQQLALFIFDRGYNKGLKDIPCGQIKPTIEGEKEIKKLTPDDVRYLDELANEPLRDTVYYFIERKSDNHWWSFDGFTNDPDKAEKFKDKVSAEFALDVIMKARAGNKVIVDITGEFEITDHIFC